MKTKEFIDILHSISFKYVYKLQGNQDQIARYFYCTVDKIYKCTTSLKILYANMHDNIDIEFSMGILTRSMLMDCIQGQYIFYKTSEITNENQEQVILEINRICLSFIADGTTHFIDRVFENSELTFERKKEVSKNLAKHFFEAFDFSGDKPKFKIGFKPKPLSKIYSELADKDLLVLKKAFENYDFYSKYDHISHWSSEINNLDLNRKEKRLQASLLYILLNLQSLTEILRYSTFDMTHLNEVNIELVEYIKNL
jgi:uncharacterized pyridoxamine 5'-phosphate oxidase family protein